MKNKNLILMVGNIGTGKSTLTKEYSKKGYVVISRDSLRYGIGAGKYIFDLEYEPTIWNTELFMFRNFVKLGVNIIIDEVGINRELRARYIKYAKSFGYTIIVIEMPKLTMNEAVNRRMNDPHGQPDRKLWEQVWTKFNNMYEKPVHDEGIDIIER